jgi:hypothetical protein
VRHYNVVVVVTSFLLQKSDASHHTQALVAEPIVNNSSPLRQLLMSVTNQTNTLWFYDYIGLIFRTFVVRSLLANLPRFIIYSLSLGKHTRGFFFAKRLFECVMNCDEQNMEKILNPYRVSKEQKHLAKMGKNQTVCQLE